MKNKLFKTLPIFIGIALIASGLVFMKLRAASEDQDQFMAYCSTLGYNLNPDSPYSNYDLDVEALQQLYHTTVNDKFNEYISRMIAGQAEAVATNVADPNSLPMPPDETTGLPQVDPLTGLPVPCDEENYSSFCVASTLLSDPTVGYMEYRRSLSCRKNALFSSTADKDTAYSAYTKFMIIGEKNEEQAINATQGARVMEISARLKAIDTEIDVAKQALDKTMVAYEELKAAWPMHKRYMQIYDSLVKYRDMMSEMRHQAEDLPNKFIDATTTKCT